MSFLRPVASTAATTTVEAHATIGPLGPDNDTVRYQDRSVHSNSLPRAVIRRYEQLTDDNAAILFVDHQTGHSKELAKVYELPILSPPPRTADLASDHRESSRRPHHRAPGRNQHWGNANHRRSARDSKKDGRRELTRHGRPARHAARPHAQARASGPDRHPMPREAANYRK